MLSLLVLSENLAVEDKSKFEQLYYRYKNILFFTAFNIVKKHADAEDVLQNAFIKIAKNIKSVGDLESRETLAFLIVITKNSAFDYIRKNYKTEEISFEDIKSADCVSDSIEDILNRLEYKKAVKAIKSIPSPYNEVLYLHYVRDYSVNKTAKLLERKTATVKMQLVRGKKILLDKLEALYE